MNSLLRPSMETINATFVLGAAWRVAGIGVASPWLQKGDCTQWPHFKAKKKVVAAGLYGNNKRNWGQKCIRSHLTIHVH